MIEFTVIMIVGFSLELCIMVLVEKWALLMYDPTMSLVYPTNLICNDNENRRKRKQIESYFEVYV